MRDLATATTIVSVVADALTAGALGEIMVDVEETHRALDRAVADVADLLDPDEVFDCVIEVPDSGHRPFDPSEDGGW